MIIEKILSNNAVLVLADDRREIVAIGKGVGFGKKVGDPIDPLRIESQFVKKSDGIADVLSQLLADIPPDCLAVTQQIITLAQKTLRLDVQDTLFLALSDHINFAIQRHKKGQTIKNLMLWDIRQFYRSEFAIGLEALALIRTRLDIDLPEDEAGFIALHLANATNNSDMQSTMQSPGIIKDILTILKYDLHITFDEHSLNYQRLVTHLKFFALRLLNRETVNHGDDSIYQGITELMPRAYTCAMKVYDYVEKNYGCQLTTDEIMFLTIHINRLQPSPA
ncbi:PRD domain-containing protein [Pectobacterium versatile]|uniref:BglG family transcription antiterminator LicT n=1 Tax=Pectobacterium versatile TaxID=2488639 RepID=UPI000D61C341|nr:MULTISPECIES: PRD domain-containing protein [Pectobacterium]MBA0164189.1 PRD domain-containing protein [Pectobacterium versatile]MBA0184059.1 PRD domain-containing protein [Pectobacterium versatile]MBD0845835.1 transcription antiterminator LicT [Pectobacterium carotovorum subsp. carotovorum]MBK4825381.1 Beta-glucoside operon antiterminator [Pectobacterium carotovorum subsp. carotovorum]MBN3059023.1 PRD domain-containing protein [Pectobacterium versatile]